ncbi:MAG: ribbon-helix-helix protein, CopG family [Candidatus Dormibacteraceae bacterium]
MEKTTLYLPTELQHRIRDLARRQHRSQAQLVREALERYLAEQPRRTFHSAGSGEDGEISGATSEDYLRARWGRG